MDEPITKTQQISPRFTHEKNINLGLARVVWVDETEKYPAGWRLPGGAITNDPDVAYGTAQTIDLQAKILTSLWSS